MLPCLSPSAHTSFRNNIGKACLHCLHLIATTNVCESMCVCVCCWVQLATQLSAAATPEVRVALMGTELKLKLKVRSSSLHHLDAYEPLLLT